MYRLKLAFRYLLNRKICYLAVVAVALCVFIVIVVMTVHTGLVTEFKNKNHKFVSDCIVSTDSMVGFAYYEEFLNILQTEKTVEAASPVVKSIGTLTRSGYDENIGIEMMGIDIENHIKTTNFASTLYYNRQTPENAFVPAYAPASPGFVAGVSMMSERDPNGNYSHPGNLPRLEIKISCVPLTAKGAMQKADTDFVNTQKFFFADDSESKLAKVDGRMIYMPIENAQILCGMSGGDERVNAIFIKFAEGVSTDEGKRHVAKLWQDHTSANSGKPLAFLFDGVTVQDWKQYRRGTIAPMEKEQTMLTILFVMVGITTVFIVFVVFYMLIAHKARDIGIMRSIGVSRVSIIRLFLLFALFIGLAGTIIGTALGKLLLWKINDKNPSSLYTEEKSELYA
ncbi:MAG: FtsX-like permease family protein [Candidatus Hydrogenedentes bacterium]|nr:FtsX-like permease family protein [Candidatus Hydrogenedentota bacterium]